MASQYIGAMPPPPGVVPNFVNPDSLERSNLIQHATCLSIITGFVIMRLYTRTRILGAKLGIDDYFCLFAYALDWVYSMLMIFAMKKGIGRHMWDVPAVQVPEAFKYLMIAAWFYLLLTGCVKLTFLFTYRSIFSMRSRIKTFIYFGIGFVVCLTASLFFASVFSCNPVERAWDVSVPGTCHDPQILAWVSAITSSVTDLYIWVLPIVPLWRLNMRPERKLKVMIAFSFGFFACIASFVRLGMTPILKTSFDASWNTASIGKWSALEVDVGIMCSCLMLLPAFLKHHLPESCKSFLTLSISRLKSSISGRSGLKSTERSSKNTWPKDKYHSIAGGKSNPSIIQTHSTGPPSQISVDMRGSPGWEPISNVRDAHMSSPV